MSMLDLLFEELPEKWQRLFTKKFGGQQNDDVKQLVVDLYETVRSDLSKGRVDHKSLMEVQVLYREQSLRLMELQKRLDALEAEKATLQLSIESYKKILKQYNLEGVAASAANARTSQTSEDTHAQDVSDTNESQFAFKEQHANQVRRRSQTKEPANAQNNELLKMT